MIPVRRFRNYSGPALHQQGTDKSRGLGGRAAASGPYSPVIEIDDDSHSRFIGAGGGDSGRGRYFGDMDIEDNEWKRNQHCQPRNSLLSLVADFVTKCSVKLQEVKLKTEMQKA